MKQKEEERRLKEEEKKKKASLSTRQCCLSLSFLFADDASRTFFGIKFSFSLYSRR